MNIQVVKQADSNLRYLIYKTTTRVLFVTQRREDEKYFDEESFALPLFLVPLLNVKDIDVENLPVHDSTFDSTLQFDNIEAKEVPESTRKLFFRHDCRDVPLTENQMGTYSMIWDLEDAWGMPSTKPWRSPTRSEERTNLEKDDDKHFTTPLPKPPSPLDNSSPETPTAASKCLAPKKRKLQRAYSDCCRCKNSLNF